MTRTRLRRPPIVPAIVLLLLSLIPPLTLQAAFTITDKFAGGDTNNGISYTSTSATLVTGSASFSLSNNELGLCVLTNRDADTPETLTGLTQTGVTWVEEVTVDGLSSAAPNGRMTLYRAMGTGAAGASLTAAVTGGADAQTNFHWQCFGVTGADLTGTNGSGAIIQTKTGEAAATANHTVTMNAARTTDSALLHFATINDERTWTAESGYTLGSEVSTINVTLNSISQYITSGSDITPQLDASGSDIDIQIAVEVKLAAAASTTFNGVGKLRRLIGGGE